MIENNIYVLDFETTTINTRYYKLNDKVTIHMGYVCNFNYTLDFVSNNIGEILYWFKNDSTIYAHNLSFDGLFIKDWLDSNGFVGINEDIPNTLIQLDNFTNKYKTKKLFTSFEGNGKEIFNLKVLIYHHDKNKYVILNFVCSFKRLNASLDSLSNLLIKNGNTKIKSKQELINQLGDQKYDLEYRPQLFINNQINPHYKNMYEYCKNDVYITIEALKWFNSNLGVLNLSSKLEHKLNNKMTSGAISLELAMNQLENEVREGIFISEASRDLADLFTMGGFTNVNSLYQDKDLIGNIKCFDINSAYPYQMTLELPIGEELTFLDINQDPKDFIIFVKVKCKTAKNKPHNTLNVIKNFEGGVTHYFKEVNDYEGYYLLDLWNFMKEKFIDVEGEELTYYYLNKKQYLKEHIEKLYQLKKEGGITIKIVLNSLYGKFATRKEFNEVQYLKHVDTNLYDIDYDSQKYYSNPNNIKFFKNNPMVKVKLKEKQDRYFNKWIANFITHNNFLKMLKAIDYFGINKFIYGDTDSIFINWMTPKENLKKEFDSDKLGDWKEEINYRVEWNSFIFRRAKLYKLNATKGVIKKAAGLNQDKIIDEVYDPKLKTILIPNAYKDMKRVKGGAIIIELDKIIAIN